MSDRELKERVINVLHSMIEFYSKIYIDDLHRGKADKNDLLRSMYYEEVYWMLTDQEYLEKTERIFL